MKGRLIIRAKLAQREVVKPEPIPMTKRIGSTTYRVNVHFSQNSTESLDDKLLRLIRNDLAGGKGVVRN
jgi:hypothetical protein